MLTGLRRLGLAENSFKLIHTLHTDASFYTEGPIEEVAAGRVGSGIRQGCPRSQYLLIAVLTVLPADVDEELKRNGTVTNTWSVMRPTFDLEYADGTLLKAFLNALETQPEFYGMRLNQTKTEILVNSGASILMVKFRVGTVVPNSTQIKYLGSMISWENSFSLALKHRPTSS